MPAATRGGDTRPGRGRSHPVLAASWNSGSVLKSHARDRIVGRAAATSSPGRRVRSLERPWLCPNLLSRRPPPASATPAVRPAGAARAAAARPAPSASCRPPSAATASSAPRRPRPTCETRARYWNARQPTLVTYTLMAINIAVFIWLGLSDPDTLSPAGNRLRPSRPGRPRCSPDLPRERRVVPAGHVRVPALRDHPPGLQHAAAVPARPAARAGDRPRPLRPAVLRRPARRLGRRAAPATRTGSTAAPPAPCSG